MDAAMFFYFVLLLLSITLLDVAWGSMGDRSEVFRNCLHNCFLKTCPSKALDTNADLREGSWSKDQTWYLKLLMWECEDECKYMCMWNVVDVFVQNNRSIPQFYGKWPFIRLFGIQEPASAIFSVLNGLAHLYMLQKFIKRVPHDAPTYRLWYAYALTSINAWFWSSVFHTRDFPFTEKMDYFGAIAGVLFSFYAFIIRVIGCNKRWKWILPGFLCLMFYAYHVHYLSFVHFDYGYNMQANVTVGILNSVGWLLFCVIKRDGRRWNEMLPCAFCVLCVNCLMLLELLDFPPFLWTLDAHSLWHCGTIPLTFVWYRFLINDSRHLDNLTKSVKTRKQF